jgi:hypothetical protein
MVGGERRRLPQETDSEIRGSLGSVCLGSVWDGKRNLCVWLPGWLPGCLSLPPGDRGVVAVSEERRFDGGLGTRPPKLRCSVPRVGLSAVGQPWAMIYNRVAVALVCVSRCLLQAHNPLK